MPTDDLRDTEHNHVGKDPDWLLEHLVSEYVDRMNRGEAIDPAEVISQHPERAAEVLRELETFQGIRGSTSPAVPLGTLGDYTLRRQIGRGGMGVVYEAWETSLGRRVALKVLPPGVAADARSSTRFLREAQIVAKLSHPQIVPVHATGIKDGTPWYAMEYVEGETLAQVLAKVRDSAPESDTPFGRKDGTPYFENLARVFADVADGLQHAHAKKVIHRDIKPSNLIFDGEGRLRILDFGLAHLEGQESLTHSGDFLGTPQYMSPEQARRRKVPVDHRTDVYSLGATMYEALTGQPPFRGRDHADTLSRIIERDAVEPHKINPRLAADLETIVLKSLRKEPADRYGTAEALGQDLRRFVRGDPIEARPQSRLERFARRVWKRRVAVLLSTALLTLLVAVGAFGLRDYRAQRWERYCRLVREAVMKVQLRKLPAKLGQEKTESAASGNPYLLGDPKVLLKVGPDPAEDAVRILAEAATLYPQRPDAWYHRARGLALLGRRDDALADIGRALGCAPGFLPAKRFEATLTSENAQENGDSAAGFPPGGEEPYLGASIEILLERGIEHVKAKEYQRAAADFIAARTLWPELAEPALLLGKTYYLMGDPALGEETFEAALATSGASDLVAFNVASFYAAQARSEEACRWIEQVREPRLRERAKTWIFLWGSRWKEAIDAGKKAIRIDSQDSMAHAFLGRVLHASGEVDEGIRMLERARDLDRRNAYVPLTLGEIFGGAGKIAEARVQYEEAVRLDPGLRSSVHLSLAGVLYGQGKYDEAVAEDKKAVAAEPEDAAALLDHAVLLFWGNRHQEVIETTKKVIKMDPQRSFAYSVLADSLFQMDQVEEAFRMHEKAIKLDGSRAANHNEYGWNLQLAGHLDRALAAFEKAAALFPEWLYPRGNLAMVHLRRGDLEQAMAHYRQALKCSSHMWEDPQRLGMRLAIGSILEQQGKVAQAFSEYVSVVDLDAAKPEGLRRLAGFLRRKDPALSVSDLEKLATALKAPLRSGGQDPLLLQTLVLVRLHNPANEDGVAAALQAIEELTDTPPYLALDAIFDIVPEERWQAALESVSSRLDYLRGRFLQRRGEAREAAEVFAGLIERDGIAHEPLRRLVESLRAAGEPEAAAGHLRLAIEGPLSEKKDLWHLWAAVSLADLGAPPSRLLEEVPKGGFSADLRWLLEGIVEERAIHINCGGPEYRSASGTAWAADRFFLGGKASQLFPVEIANTEDAPLYQHHRDFRQDEGSRHGYEFPLLPGEYRVTLHFVEVWFQVPGMRRFDVFLDDQKVLEDYEPFAAGPNTAEKKGVTVAVTDGLLEIEFVPRVGNPAIAAIEIERVE